jgi:hypothetical protein
MSFNRITDLTDVMEACTEIHDRRDSKLIEIREQSFESSRVLMRLAEKS